MTDMEPKDKSRNLCNIYVLPLLGLTKHSFGENRFVNSYLSEDNCHIVVRCTHPFSAIITNHANFCFQMEQDSHYLAVFAVPEYYKRDAERFRRGEYSKFSTAAKDLIKKKSGLPFRVVGRSGKYNTALELLALDKDPVLKKYWEEQLSNKGSKVVLDDDAELASIPDDDNFFTLNLSDQLTPLEK